MTDIFHYILSNVAAQTIYTIAIFIAGWGFSWLRGSYKKDAAIQEGLQALLRDDILRIRTRTRKQGSISYTQKENLIHMTAAYFKLGGNGVIEKIAKEMEILQPYSDVEDISDDDE